MIDAARQYYYEVETEKRLPAKQMVQMVQTAVVYAGWGLWPESMVSHVHGLVVHVVRPSLDLASGEGKPQVGTFCVTNYLGTVFCCATEMEHASAIAGITVV